MEELIKDKNSKITDIVTNISSHKKVVPEQLKEATKFYNSFDYQKTLDILKTVDVSPDVFDKSFYMGNCLYKLGNKAEAETYWIKSSKEAFSSPYACVNLGNLYYAQRNYQKAVFYWHKALVIEPECSNANLNIAIYYSNRDCRDIAIKYYRKYIKYYHSDRTSEDYKKVKEFLYRIDKYCEAYVQKAGEAFEQHDYNKAAEYYLRAVYNNPCEPKINNFLGDMYFKVKNYPKALQYHLLAYRNDPLHFMSVVNIALTFEKLELFDYAYCFYKRMVHMVAKESIAYSNLIKLMHKVAPGIPGNQRLFNEHLRAAQDFEKDSLYQKAYEEYENAFIIMNSKEEKAIIEHMRMLKKFLDPEAPIITRLMEKIDKYFNNEEYEKIIPLCNRVIAMARPASQEYQNAYGKRNIANKKLDPLSNENAPD